MVSTSFQVYLSARVGAGGIGLLQLVLSVGSLAMTAGIAGIRTSSMYLTAEELGKKRPENVQWVLSGCFGYSILCGSTVAVLLYLFAPWLAEFWIGDPRTLPAIRLLAVFLPVSCLCGVMIGYFTAANRIGTLAAVEVAEQLLSMSATMLLLLFWAGCDPVRAILSVVLGSSLGGCFTLISLVALRLREKIPTGPRLRITRRLLETAVPLALADDLKSGISTAENLMVPKRLGLYPGVSDPLAVFGTVCGMVFPILMFPAAILFGLAELLIPELARCAAAGSERRIKYLAGRSLHIALLYGSFFAGLQFLLAEPLCMALYKSPEAVRWLQRFSFLIPMLYCDAITDAMTKGLGQQKICVRYNILTSALDVLFLYLLLPKFGMEGYFLSFLVTHLLNFILSLRRLLKITGPVISLRRSLAALLAAALSLAGGTLVSQPMFSALGFSLLLGSFWVLFRVFGREDLCWLRGLFRKSR